MDSPSPIDVKDSSESDITPKVAIYKRLHKLEWKTYLKVSILLILVVFIILAIVYNKQTINITEDFLNWLENNPEGGAVIFIFVYFLATVLFIPGLILTVGAGFVFAQILGQALGVVVATLVVLIGATAGASAAFLIGRFVLRESIEELAEKSEKFSLIDDVVKINGFKVVLLLRLAPIIPFNAFNYFMGLTSVTFKQYFMASIGMIPGTLAYCFLGSTISAIGDASGAGFTSNTTVFVVFIVGCVVAFVGMFYIGYIAKKEFEKLAAKSQENKANANINANEPEMSKSEKSVEIIIESSKEDSMTE